MTFRMSSVYHNLPKKICDHGQQALMASHVFEAELIFGQLQKLLFSPHV